MVVVYRKVQYSLYSAVKVYISSEQGSTVQVYRQVQNTAGIQTTTEQYMCADKYRTLQVYRQIQHSTGVH